MSQTVSDQTGHEPHAPPSQPEPARRPGRARALAAWLLRAVPTVLIFAVLGGLAWWGHQTGWAIPRLSELTGATEAKDDWCEEHGVPESLCVECNPGLLPRPPAYGWCPQHGVHDCPLDHPDVAQLRSLGGVPFDELKDQAGRALRFAERKGNDCQCTLHPRRIQVASVAMLDRMGIGLEPVARAPIEEVVAASGEIAFDPEHVTSLSVPVPGRIWRVQPRGTVGQAVAGGDVLALVDAAEVGKAKAEFLQALGYLDLKTQTLGRLRPGAEAGVIPEARLREAEAALREAQIRLVGARQALVNLGLPIRAEAIKGLALEEVARRIPLLGLPDDVARELGPETATANLLPVRVPFDGVVIARQAALGATADPTRSLFVVADPRRLWLTLHVPQESLKPFREKDPQRLLAGKTVRFVPDGTAEAITATISWVGASVDEKTRTLAVRAELGNPQGRLRANTFGAGRIILRREEKALVVPTEAIHWEGKCHVVFVWDKNASRPGTLKVFHVRTVLPGVRDGQRTEIIAGLLPGEMIATTNSGILRAELLKSSLDESCGCGH